MRFKNNYKEKVKEFVEKNNLTYSINTMGCELNENDSAKYRGILESMGFKKSESEDTANFILFNTCAVRENAENTLYGRLGFFKSRKIKEKNVYIAVVGCMSQQKHVISKIQNSYRFVDIILGTSGMNIFPKKVYEALIEGKKKLEYIDIDESIIEGVPIIYQDTNKASISIIYGCNNFCTFCIVPHVRGRERSRSIENILGDVKHVVKKGYKEIVLLGQNVNSYGNDLKDGTNFAKLLEEIEKIDGVEIIRFMSPHPKDFSDELIDVISKSNKISKLIHLPLQSGNNNILKKMNRKYTKEKYLKLVEKIREKIPDASFTTDIIVGFPNETNEEFLDTLDVVKKVRYDQIFMFIYSKRKGTIAEKMQDNITYEEKVERLQILKKLHEEILKEENDKLIGKTFKLLVEGISKTNDKLYTGRLDSNKIVVFEGNENDVGKICKILIKENHLWYLKGEKI